MAASATPTLFGTLGKLFALEEGHRPFALDPETLAAQGFWDFDGAFRGARFTAHPKIDPETGEMVFFAYLAQRAFSRRRSAYGVIDKTGKLTRFDNVRRALREHGPRFHGDTELRAVPRVAADRQHATRHVRQDRPMPGKPSKRSHVGVMRRNADFSSVRWFECDPCYVFHPMNAYEDGDKIVGDVMQYDAAPLFPDPNGRAGDPAKAIAHLTRWTFDLASNSDGFKREQIDDLAGEFPRFDERLAGLDYRHGYFAASSDREGARCVRYPHPHRYQDR